MEIIVAVCTIVIIIALCKVGIEALLNIVLSPVGLICLIVGLLIWGTISLGIGTTVLIVLCVISLYFIMRKKH